MFARRFTLAVVTAIATAAVLTSCAPVSAPKTQDLTFVIEGANLSAGHMDPQTSQLDVSALVQRNVLDSLVAQNTDGSFVPWLATSWKISDDQLHYTFQLRDDVTFHDGTPFNADAVKANFDRITAPATASAQAASMMGYSESGGAYLDTEVVEEFTVQVNFARPFAPFLSAASTALLGFWSPAVLVTQADQLKTGGPGISVGTGPFILTKYVPDQEIVYSANPDYAWGPANIDHSGRSDIDTLTVRILPEASVRIGALNSGEAQVAANLTPVSVEQLDPSLVVKSVQLPGIPYSLYLNEKYGVFSDERVRQAFSVGFDGEAAVTSIFAGLYPKAWSILSPTTPNSYDASLQNTGQYDPEKANALLDAAGWTTRDTDGYRTKDGARLSVRWIAYTPIPDDRAALADIIQSDLKKIGFEVIREALEPAAYNEQYGPKTFDLTDWGNASLDADVLRSQLSTTGFQNASQVSDAEVDSLLDQAVGTSDPVARAALYAQVQQWNATHVAAVPLYVPSLITAAVPELSGLSYDLYGRPLFYGASLGQ